MENRPTFKLHNDFIFEYKKVGVITREEFIKYVRSTHEHMRELSKNIQQYDQTIDDYFKELDGMIDLFELNESVRMSNEEERELNETERISKDSERDSKIEEIEDSLESKANKQQEDWITPTLLNGWVNFDDGTVYQTCQYMKDTLGFVHIKGMVKNGTGIELFKLPDGYRPIANSYFSCATVGTNEAYQFIIDRSGQVRIPHTLGKAWYSISVIFKAKEE